MSENSDGQVEKVILNNSLNEAVDRGIEEIWRDNNTREDGCVSKRKLANVLYAMRQPEKTDDQLSSAKSTTIKVISADITKEQLKCDCPYCGKNIILFMPPPDKDPILEVYIKHKEVIDCWIITKTHPILTEISQAILEYVKMKESK